MGRKFIFSLPATAGLLVASVQPAYAADNVIVLEPLSKWTLDFAEEKCRLVRTFGTEDNVNLLMFELARPGNSPGITMAGSAVDHVRVRRGTVITLNEAEGARENLQPYAGKFGEIGNAAIFSGVRMATPADSSEEGSEPDEAAEEARSIGEIDLEYANSIEQFKLSLGKKAAVFKTGKMGPAFQALNVCTADLVRAWGLDPEQHKSYQKAPEWTNVKKVVPLIQRNYPQKALRAGQSAIMSYRVIVEADGKLSECQLTNQTDADKLESPACDIIMKHAEFKPALDADGNPMRSFHASRITYQIN